MISKIQVENYGYLDTSEDFPIPVNFSLNEIQDISKRGGNYTKTVKLPMTANNKELLGFLYDVNIADGTYNVNRKRDVIVLKNGVPQFEGYMQLLGVSKTSPTSPNQDEQGFFEVQIKDSLISFYSSMGDQTLDTLTAFENSAHTLTFANVQKTSGYTATQGYKYFLPYKTNPTGTTIYNLSDFQPAISARKYWDAIWHEAGFSYEWSTMTAETCFNNLWIPYNGGSPTRDTTNYSFKASISADTAQIDMGRVPRLGVEWYDHNLQNDVTVPFNIDSGSNLTGALYDSGSTFDISTNTHTQNFYGSTEYRVKYKCELWLKNENAFDIQLLNFGTLANDTFTINFKAIISAVTAGNTTAIYDKLVANSDGSDYVTGGTGTYILANNYNMFATFTTNELIVNSGVTYNTDVICSLAVGQYNNATLGTARWHEVPANRELGTVEYPRLEVKFTPELVGVADYRKNYFKNKPSTYVDELDPISLTDYIPKNIKRKDFISSILKMFNLYVTPTENPKVFKIETRDEFYLAGSTLDWTHKLAVEKEQTLKFLPDLTAEKYLFTHKLGKDEYSSIYQKATGEIYGQLQYDFDNDFVTDTKKIETIFQSTPLVENGSKQIVSAIRGNSANTEVCILYDGGAITPVDNSVWSFSASSAPTTIKTFTKYVYMGHYNSPYTPTEDINFGENDYLFYNTWQTLTDNNLFNKHYLRFITQIQSGKLYTAKLRLTELDILNFNPRDKIYIGDTYYYVNAIIDYDANAADGLTKVEFINIDEGNKFAASISQSNPFEVVLAPDEGDVSEA